MTESTSAHDLFKVTDELKPAAAEDAAERSMYVAGSMLIHSARTLQSVIERGRAGEFGEQVRKVASGTFSDSQLRSASKELCCVSIYLIALGQGGEDAPQWLRQLLFDSLRGSDLLVPSPSAKWILQVHEFVAGEESMYSEAAASICRTLGCNQEAAGLEAAFAESLRSGKQYRQEVLRNALMETLETLRK